MNKEFMNIFGWIGDLLKQNAGNLYDTCSAACAGMRKKQYFI